MPDGTRYARQAATVLLEFAAYDYALVGTLAGEKARVVAPERWAVVARENVTTIGQLSAATVSASADASGPVREKLVALADSLTELSREASAYAGGRQPQTFAAVLDRVTASWSRLGELATLLPPDAELAAKVTRGTQIQASARGDSVWVLNVGPFNTRADALAAARAIGTSESVGEAAPFIIRVAAFPSKALAETKANSLKGMPGSLVVEEQRWLYTRAGPASVAELWREPVRVFDLPAGARRIAVSSDAAWIAAGSDDGSIALFAGDGTLRALPKLRVSIAHLAFADDGKTLMGGGVNLAVLQVPGMAQLGPLVTLTSPATQVLFVPSAGARSFVATAKGPNGTPAGGPGVIAARAPDGVALGSPFPLTTPAAGAVLATSDAGELFVATPAPGGLTTDVEVVRVGFERALRAVVGVPGTVRLLAVDRAGQLGAVLTDQGLFRFAPKGGAGQTPTRVMAAARDMAFGSDGTLYVLEQTKLSAVDKDGKVLWSAALVDGRRLLAAKRPLVLEGLDRVLVADVTGALDDLGVGGSVTDVAMSVDGRKVAVAVNARTGFIFDLP